jgi:hypothetical protein
MNDALEWLKAENARLQRQLAQHGVHPLAHKAVLPDAAATVQLFSKIIHAFPQLRSSQCDFELSLLYLSYARRAEKLDSAHYPVFSPCCLFAMVERARTQAPDHSRCVHGGGCR